MTQKQEETSGTVDPEREITVTESVTIEDGVHSGTISRLEFRDEPYKYCDIFILLKGTQTELKAGFPQNISANSTLGRLLMKFGVKLVKDEKIKPYHLLVGKEVKFQTITEIVDIDGRKVEFARVVKDSIKPQ